METSRPVISMLKFNKSWHLDCQQYECFSCIIHVLSFNLFLCRHHEVVGAYSVTHSCQSFCVSFPVLFFSVLVDNELVLGVFLYIDDLKVKYEFHVDLLYIFTVILSLETF